VKSDSLFAPIEENNQELDALIKCKIVNIGKECSRYKVNDFILVRADFAKEVKHEDCPEDVLIINNERLIFCKLKDE